MSILQLSDILALDDFMLGQIYNNLTQVVNMSWPYVQVDVDLGHDVFVKLHTSTEYGHRWYRSRTLMVCIAQQVLSRHQQ